MARTCLYSALGGIPPSLCLAISVDVGTDNEDLLEDPSYIGLREHRQHVELMDELMEALVKRWGRHTLVHLEGFGDGHALLERYRNRCCVFSYEIQCSAALTLSSLLKRSAKLSQKTFLLKGDQQVCTLKSRR